MLGQSLQLYDLNVNSIAHHNMKVALVVFVLQLFVVNSIQWVCYRTCFGK